MASDKSGPASSTPLALRIFYIALNVFAAVSIVFANKAVFSLYRFHFVTTLTLVHTLFTFVGMLVLSRLDFFTPKKLPQVAIAPLALGYVGYIVFNNLSLNLNTVGFYQILKIMIAPAVIVMEFLMFGKVQNFRIIMAVAVVCVGVGIAAVTDKVSISNVLGVIVGAASVIVTALYQIWAGSKQKELQANSSQLLLAYTPQAIALLVVLVPLFDDVGFTNQTVDTVLGYEYSWGAISAIVVSALLGVLVSLSTFLVIGATSSLTYNVVGHFKTVLILTGGCVLFGEDMPWKRFMGICLTMTGIIWYTVLSAQAAQAPAQAAIPVKEASPVSPEKERLLPEGKADQSA
ncbi:hypothetical protein GPECTOR_27g729 [Gonium pectorale]|uniref:Sugar phosphate transporter domain-containing protein n=1 Tax=Gonium pectorale TaxID=33097 RepID=A0A150GFF7_GONPE|nr:hypothetical protein GPECTOR_27g729 [Gonium pectorale]|eukprot:KXZ48558.1 hypothetical protein GPECTOR_27g729 [Gonium pectorale]